MYEGRRASPLFSTGALREIEVGALLPGGSAFLFEVGLSGSMLPGRQGFAGRHIGQAITVFGGLRIDLCSFGRPALGLEPRMRAGIGFSAVRDRITVLPSMADVANDRLSLGPYMAFGAERELWFGTSIGVYVRGEALVAPIVGSIGLGVVVSTQALP